MVKPNSITLLPATGFHSRFTLEPDGAAPNLPNLWQAAGQMHERILTRIATPTSLSHTARMPYNERHGLLAWIEPVEHLVRYFLIASAITFLLMTVKGRKLLRDTPKMPVPQPPGFGRAALQHREERIVMPHPGWHTIANAPRPPPAKAEPAAPEPEQPSMSLDPKTWACPFNVIRWRFQQDDTHKPRPAAFDMLLESMRDPHIPLRTSHDKRTLQSAQERSAQQKSSPRHSGNPCAVNLARRLEAVGRVLENPQRHIMRVARYIARLPAGLLDQDFELPPSRRFWQQGREAFTGAVRLLCSAIRALNLCAADPEPG
ncbi:MAG TPA: hypothetical protein VGO52_06895 [Hyphomonadaceae bacterium]|jgi:hypothetical protein|nr:hypothetical protein [Hyphomonadaceae bacterium]